MRVANSPEPSAPSSPATTNRATARLYATTRTTAKRLIISSAALVERGPPRIVTGSR